MTRPCIRSLASDVALGCVCAGFDFDVYVDDIAAEM